MSNGKRNSRSSYILVVNLITGGESNLSRIGVNGDGDGVIGAGNTRLLENSLDVRGGVLRGEGQTVVDGVADLGELGVSRFLPALIDEVQGGGDDDRGEDADYRDDDDKFDQGKALLLGW